MKVQKNERNVALQDLTPLLRASPDQSEIMTDIRRGLIQADKNARASNNIDRSGCTCGDDIDSYHRNTFAKEGLPVLSYGGWWAPQGLDLDFLGLRNPVPYDNRGVNPVDDFYNRHWGQP